MNSSGFARRCFRLFALVCMAVVLMSARIIFLSESAKPFRGYQKSKHIVLGRGKIMSADGSVLAVSLPRHSIVVDPVLFDDAGLELLAGAVGLNPHRLAARIRAARDAGRRYMVIAREVPESVAAKVEELGIRGVYLELRWRRQYPFGELGAHVVGFAGRASDRKKAKLFNDSFEAEGKYGVERAYDEFLAPKPGEVRGARVLRVSYPVLTRGLESVNQPQFGHQVVLNINLWFQRILEEELAAAMNRTGARAAWGVILDANTGAVLAMASLPSFDPNSPASGTHFNAAISAQVEPGSVIKPFALAAALEAGIPLSTRIDCENGFYRVGRYEISDVHPHGVLNLAEIVEVSSNIGICKLAQMMGARSFYATLRSFGFGRRTGIDLVGEAPGRLRTPESRYWNRYDLIANSYGHGMSVTAIQLASAFAALVNGGRLYRPRVVREIRDQWGNVIERFVPELVARPISERTSQQMIGVLKRVVYGEHGTGKAARVPGVEVIGKTGTAWKIENGRYIRNRHTATFVGAFPLPDVSYVVVVVVDDPSGPVYMHYASRAAAPVFRRVVERMLLLLDSDSLPRPARLVAAGSKGGSADRTLLSKFLSQIRTLARLRAEQREAAGEGF